MCTAIVYGERFFGRNLDDMSSYGEEVVQTPRGFAFPFGEVPYAILGMAYLADGVPLFYDAMNEKGLAMAGLLFQGNAVYRPIALGKENIPSWALVARILGCCGELAEAEALLQKSNITREPFCAKLPPSPLHWMLTDGKRTIVIEQTEKGLEIHENPVGTLTNNPPFLFHLEHLRQYLSLSAKEAENQFLKRLQLGFFSRGMGAFGLPGDWSSSSRFVRAVFVRENSPKEARVNDFFHILSAVAMPQGSIRTSEGEEKTFYTSCCDLKEQIYYYQTYENHRLTAIKLEPSAKKLRRHRLHREEEICWITEEQTE